MKRITVVISLLICGIAFNAEARESRVVGAVKASARAVVSGTNHAHDIVRYGKSPVSLTPEFKQQTKTRVNRVRSQIKHAQNIPRIVDPYVELIPDGIFHALESVTQEREAIRRDIPKGKIAWLDRGWVKTLNRSLDSLAHQEASERLFATTMAELNRQSKPVSPNATSSRRANMGPSFKAHTALMTNARTKLHFPTPRQTTFINTHLRSYELFRLPEHVFMSDAGMMDNQITNPYSTWATTKQLDAAMDDAFALTRATLGAPDAIVHDGTNVNRRGGSPIEFIQRDIGASGAGSHFNLAINHKTGAREVVAHRFDADGRAWSVHVLISGKGKHYDGEMKITRTQTLLLKNGQRATQTFASVETKLKDGRHRVEEWQENAIEGQPYIKTMIRDTIVDI